MKPKILVFLLSNKYRGRVNRISKHIPNVITQLNLLSGVLSIIITPHNLQVGVLLILIAAVFDLLDGIAARLLNATSEIGKQLDSFADLISFGLAPSWLLLYVFNKYIGITKLGHANFERYTVLEVFLLLMIFSPLFVGSIRLARFNIKTKVSEHFKGLPIPASALIIVGYCYFRITTDFGTLKDILIAPGIVLLLVISVDILMLLNLRMISFKMNSFRIKENYVQYLLIITAIPQVVLLKRASLLTIMVSYVMFSIYYHFITSNKKAVDINH